MNRFIFMLPILLAIAACSRDDGAAVKSGVWAVEMQAGFAGGDVEATLPTRSDTKAFSEPFDLFLTQTSPSGADYLLPSAKYDVTGSEAFTLVNASGNTIYWDDIGGRAALLSFVAVYPKGVTGAMAQVAPGTGDSFDFEVAQDQSVVEGGKGVNFIASDLLVSEWVTGYSVNKQITQTTPVITFNHVLSKLTFNITADEGFDEQEIFEPSLNIDHPFYREGKVTIPAASGSVSIACQGMTTKNMTPYKNTKGEFELVVMPNQTIDKTKVLAVVTVTTGKLNDEDTGVENTYKISIPEDITLAAGHDYRFEVTINKTDGEITSTVVTAWDEGAKTENNDVRINVGDGTGTNSGVENGAKFLMSIDKYNTIYTYTETETDIWEWDDPKPPIFWDDVERSEDLIAEAVLYNADDLSDINPEHIYVGQTAQEALKEAIKFIQFTDMEHPFAKINLVINTTAAGDKVDLSKISQIEFHSSIQMFEELDTDTNSPTFRSITYTDAILGYSDGTLTDNVFTAKSIYIDPVKDVSGILLEVTTITPATPPADGSVTNVYPMKIAADNKIDFEAGKVYDITLTLRKTEIAEVGVEITGWKEAAEGITGSGTIDK